MLIQEFLERSTERLPDKTALVAGADRYTYKAINVAANKLAHGLNESGVAYGDRIVVYLDNSAETVISIFGILKADAVFVVVNPIPGQEERNSDHLLEEGAAIRCNNLPTLAYKIDRLLDDPDRLAVMRDRVRQLARPLAAQTIVNKLLDLRCAHHL